MGMHQIGQTYMHKGAESECGLYYKFAMDLWRGVGYHYLYWLQAEAEAEDYHHLNLLKVEVEVEADHHLNLLEVEVEADHRLNLLEVEAEVEAYHHLGPLEVVVAAADCVTLMVELVC